MKKTTKDKILELYRQGNKPYQIGKKLKQKPPYAYVYKIIKETKK